MAFTSIRLHTSDEAYKDYYLVKERAGNAIGLLTASACSGPNGTKCENETWRVDSQNQSQTHYNLQVQRNGVFNQKSTIAGVKIRKSLIAEIAGQATNAAAREARDVELTRAIHGALTLSAGSWRHGGPAQNLVYSFDFFEVDGSFSS
jgi:hypothetical protein